MVNGHDITTLDGLRGLYREPSALVQAKKVGRIDEVTREVLEGSPLFLLATSGSDGSCDVSPRGGPPGQLVVLDDETLAFPDLNGNNLVDSLTNIVANPHVGLLVITPGTDETLRVDGTATITTDPDLLGRWEGLLRRPKVAVRVTVEHAFLHCAKAFRRAELWDPASWTGARGTGVAPDPVDMLHSQLGMESDPAATRRRLEGSYEEGLAADRPE